MEDSIPLVLGRLAQYGVFVQLRDGKAAFKAKAAPPADIVDLINACKAEVSAFLHPEVVQRRLDAEAEVLQAPCPPDVSDDRWEAALEGLRAFIASGHGGEAERLGWPRHELYRVPELWSQIWLCGVGLLIGVATVTGVTATEIKIRTVGGANQTFYRKPQPNLYLVYTMQLKLRRCENPADDEEAQLRAREFTVNFHRAHTSCDFETAKQAMTDALKATS
jgi:hypothetical protein